MELIEKLPKRHRLATRSICLDLLFHARRHTGTEGGVSLKRGQVLYSERSVAQRCYVTYQTTRTVISWLKKVHFLTHDLTHLSSVASIVHFDRYINDGKQTNAETNEQLTHNQRSTKVKGKKKHIYTPKNSEEADHALLIWENHAALPTSANRGRCLEVLDELHRIDKVRWEGADGIYAICSFAAQHWVPNGYIGSPVSLRQSTRAKDMRKYESIQRQIAAKGSKNHPGGLSKPVKYQIAFPDGKPITEYEKRLLRILHNDWTTDPDQGHVFTISDDNIVRAKAEGVESFLRGRQPEKGEEHAA